MFDVTKEAFKHTRLFANQKAAANADKVFPLAGTNDGLHRRFQEGDRVMVWDETGMEAENFSPQCGNVVGTIGRFVIPGELDRFMCWVKLDRVGSQRQRTRLFDITELKLALDGHGELLSKAITELQGETK